MCGRYGLYASAKEIEDYFALDATNFNFEPSYNIAPTEINPIIILNNKKKTLEKANWGITPKWKRSAKLPLLINSRIETVREKKFFYDIFNSKRCIVPVNGFFEWRLENGKKQPYYFYPSSGKLFAFAGIYTEVDNFLSYSIITKPANQKIATYHSRMPSILQASEINQYLDNEASVNNLFQLLESYAVDINCHAVSTSMNSAKSKISSIILPINSV